MGLLSVMDCSGRVLMKVFLKDGEDARFYLQAESSSVMLKSLCTQTHLSASVHSLSPPLPGTGLQYSSLIYITWSSLHLFLHHHLRPSLSAAIEVSYAVVSAASKDQSMTQGEWHVVLDTHTHPEMNSSQTPTVYLV